jgi:signal peptidase II
VQLVGGLAFLVRLPQAALGRAGAVCASCCWPAGRLATALDRLFHRHVVDFIHLTHWPVFNVADIYITVGGMLLFLAYRSAKDTTLATD